MTQWRNIKFRFLALIPVLLLISSCATLNGELRISGDGKVTGILTYTIDKGLAQLAGINSLDQLNVKLQEPGEVDFQDNCPNPQTSEDSSKYTVECRLSNSDFSTDKDFGVYRELDSLVFVFRQNMNESSSSESTIELGSVLLDIEFSTPVLQATENRPGLLKKISDTKYRISGTASEKIDIRVIARSSAVGETSVENYGSPIPREIVDRAKNFKIAPTTIGGMISSDLRFTKGNSPYLVKSTIEIPKGKVVYVEPGVEFDSGSLTRLTDDKGATFHVQGKVYFDGSPEERIKLFGSPVTHFQSKFAGEDAGIYANYLHVVGGRNFIGDRTSESRINFKIHNSRIRNVKNSWEIVYPFGKNELVNNHFETTSQIRALVHTSSGELRIERNKFVGRAVGQSEKGKDCWIEGVAYYGGQLRVLENDFSKVEGFALCVLYSDGQIDGRSNFWGSIDEVRIMQKVLDSRDGLSYPSIIDVSSPLSQSKYNFIGTGISASDKAVSAAKAAELAKFEAMDATIEASELARIAAREAEASAAASKLGSGSQKSTSSLGREKTISCVKGKQRLKVIGKNPKCPSGFKISK